MLKIVFDHNFNHGIQRGLSLRLPGLDFVTAHELGMRSAHDLNLLRWAALNGRVLVTHDRRSMQNHFATILLADESTAGILIVPQTLTIRRAIDELEFYVVCDNHEEWIDRIHII